MRNEARLPLGRYQCVGGGLGVQASHGRGHAWRLHSHVHMHTHTRMCWRMHAHVHGHTCPHARAHMHALVCTLPPRTHTVTHMWTHTHHATPLLSRRTYTSDTNLFIERTKQAEMNVNAKIKSDRNESCHLHSGVVSFHVVQNQAVWAQESNSDTYWLCNLPLCA